MAARTVIAEKPAEGGHLGLSCTFYDELDATVVPRSIEWTLTDQNGSVIDSASSVSCATTITILLSGTDLALSNRLLKKRLLFLEWTFNSTLGTDIPDKHEVEFTIQNMVAEP